MKIGTSILELRLAGYSRFSLGKLLLIEFWSISCPFCKDNMPEIERLLVTHKEKLVRLSIHHPMGPDEVSRESVMPIAQKLGFGDELIFDNDHKIGDEVGVTGFPTYLLFDKDGMFRRKGSGQFGLKIIEQAILRLNESDS